MLVQTHGRFDWMTDRYQLNVNLNWPMAREGLGLKCSAIRAGNQLVCHLILCGIGNVLLLVALCWTNCLANKCSRVALCGTVRLLTYVLCKTTHFFFLSFIVAISYSLQTSFNSVMIDWADKYHVWGTPTESPSMSDSR